MQNDGWQCKRQINKIWMDICSYFGCCLSRRKGDDDDSPMLFGIKSSSRNRQSWRSQEQDKKCALCRHVLGKKSTASDDDDDTVLIRTPDSVGGAWLCSNECWRTYVVIMNGEHRSSLEISENKKKE